MKSWIMKQMWLQKPHVSCSQVCIGLAVGLGWAFAFIIAIYPALIHITAVLLADPWDQPWTASAGAVQDGLCVWECAAF